MKFVAALLVVAVIAQTNALTCWKCNEDHFTDCASNETETCEGKCMKIAAVVGNHGGARRSCSSNCVELNSQGLGTFCCETDLCNNAPIPAISFALILMTALLHTIFRN